MCYTAIYGDMEVLHMNTTKQDIVFANMYFFTLILTAVVVLIKLLGNAPAAHYLPFAIGGIGSLFIYVYLIYIGNFNCKQLKIKSKILCHSLCSAVYIIGAFVLLVFSDVDFISAWLYHIWIIPILILSSMQIRRNGFVFVLIFGIFISLFVLDTYGVVSAAIRAAAMGSFWGFSFYFLLGFWSDMKKYYGKILYTARGNENELV